MPPGKLGKRILITGITGFVGSHMADALAEGNWVFGLRHWHRSSVQNVKHIQDKITWIDCDLTDPISVQNLIEDTQPEEVYHFAAESFVSPSWQHPHAYMRANYDVTVNLLESLFRIVPNTRILIPGSGEEYGEVAEEDLPITTATPLRPVNPYAVSKIAQDLIGMVYYKSCGLPVIRTRSFNTEGPRRANVFGIPWYAYQIASIEAGLQAPVVRVGHTEDRRNFTHILDMVQAYQLAMQCCEPGQLYLIGTQDIHTFKDALLGLIASSSCKGIAYEQVPEFTRPTQVPRLIADCEPFTQLTRWKPERNFYDILGDTLEYWRARVLEDAK